MGPRLCLFHPQTRHFSLTSHPPRLVLNAFSLEDFLTKNCEKIPQTQINFRMAAVFFDSRHVCYG